MVKYLTEIISFQFILLHLLLVNSEINVNKCVNLPRTSL